MSHLPGCWRRLSARNISGCCVETGDRPIGDESMDSRPTTLRPSRSMCTPEHAVPGPKDCSTTRQRWHDECRQGRDVTVLRPGRIPSMSSHQYRPQFSPHRPHRPSTLRPSLARFPAEHRLAVRGTSRNMPLRNQLASHGTVADMLTPPVDQATGVQAQYSLQRIARPAPG